MQVIARTLSKQKVMMPTSSPSALTSGPPFRPGEIDARLGYQTPSRSSPNVS